jgi:ubiquinone/menaquinone biosynthesis C-methylase UbiE
MSGDNTARVQQSFGPNAQKYAHSAVFASSPSLDRLIELLDPQPGWTALDIATGGGHTALRLARRVQQVVAVDITPQMLRAAEDMIAAQGVANVSFHEADAQNLPFPGASFDLVTCRIAPHHFPDVQAFVRESARVARPAGVVAVVDNVSPPDPFGARYFNAYEKLRDPSHHWAYTPGEWQAFFADLGLRVTALETFRKAFEFGDYCDRMSVPEADRHRLRAMLVHAPKTPRAYFDIFERGGALWFHLAEVLIVGAT